jgi:acyl carrier protein
MADDLMRCVLDEVISAVKHIEEQSGREALDLDGSVVPLEMGGFDSLNCVETVVILSERLGVTVEHRVFATSGGVPLSCTDIARAIVAEHGSAIKIPSGASE